MPVLKNAKHERFAQELFKGETADAAYVAAGFSANRGNATRLKANESIAARVIELQSRVAERTEITVAAITDRLLAIALKAEGKDEAAMLGVARASLMDAAKLNGLIVEKRDHTSSDGSMAPPSVIQIVGVRAQHDDGGGPTT